MNTLKSLFLAAIVAAAPFVVGRLCAQTPVATEELPTTTIPVILDADVGSSTDDLFALMMLHQYVDEGVVRLLGVVCDREGEKNAEMIDLLNVYYGHPDVPIGLERDGVKNPRVFIPYSGIVDLKDDDGAPLFKRAQDGDAFPDGYKLYRKLLAEAEDGSVEIVAIGFVTTLSKLFDSEGDEYSPLTGLELFAQKVKAVYLQAGRFQAGDNLSGYNMRAAAHDSENFYGKFPRNVQMRLSPSYVGDFMDYPPDDVLADLSYTELNPIKSVYANYDCDTGQRMWDVNCVLNAVEGDEIYNLSPRGWVTFVNRGKNSEMYFEEDPQGNARYQRLGDSYDCQSKVMTIRKMTRVVPNPSSMTIESPQPQLVGEQARAWASERLGLLADRYMGSARNRLDPDKVRDLFYPLGYTGPNWKDYEAAERIVVDEIFKRMAERAVRQGCDDLVVVTGAPGCGKSYAVRELGLDDAGLVYDAAITEEGRFDELVGIARDAGLKKLVVIPVYNDVLTCYQNTILRGQTTGRHTSLEYMVRSFRSNAGWLQSLRERYPDAEIMPVDCSGNRGVVRVSLDEALGWNYEVGGTELRGLLLYLKGLLNRGELEGELTASAAGNLLAIPGMDEENEQLARETDQNVRRIVEASRMKY